MSPENSEQNKIGIWMKFVVPNDLPREEALERTKAIAHLRYEGVEIGDDDAIRIGTIIELPVQITGVKEPRHDNDLNEDERQVKIWQDEYLEDVEVEGDR